VYEISAVFEQAIMMDGFSKMVLVCTHIKFHNQLVEIQHYIPPGDWPPNSPDLPPIENVWGCLQCFDSVGWAAGRASGL